MGYLAMPNVTRLKKLIRIALVWVVVAQTDVPAQGRLQRGGAGAKSTVGARTKIFEPILASLREKTGVPLRLPSFVPYDGDKEYPTYAILESAGKEGYSVELAWEAACGYVAACHIGSVRGNRDQLPENEGTRTAVLLAHKIRGYVITSEIAAYPSDARVGWFEDGFHYSITLKGGDKKTVLRMANSAINRGIR